MKQVISVEIERRKDLLHYTTTEKDIKKNDKVIVKSLIGEEMGRVIRVFGESFNKMKNISSVPPILRKASKEDMHSFEKKTENEKKALEFCLKIVKEKEIPIKIVRVRYFTSERKAIFYFTSEGRIDFRDLVMELANRYRMRIEMRQIGIRDEAKMIGGIGTCGRELCCKKFLNNLEPITLQMAKRQNLNVNPIKISGQCGRLMCCLSYEKDSGGRVFIEDNQELVGYNEEEEDKQNRDEV